MGDKSLTDVHFALIELYGTVMKISQKHGFKVFVTGGTTLGAIRHNGFIPWDDDMDLALPRKDYDKLAEVMTDEIPDYMRFVWIPRASHYRLLNLRQKVTLNESYRKIIDDNGQEYAAIDIQPFDGVPNGLKGKLHCVKVLAYRACFKMCDPNRIIYNESWRKWWELCLIGIMRRVRFLFKNEDHWKMKFEKAMRKYDYYDCDVIADFVGKYKFKDVYPKAWWEPGKWVPFQDTKVLVPCEYDKYLTGIYGDYNTIPAEHERIVHSKNNE